MPMEIPDIEENTEIMNSTDVAPIVSVNTSIEKKSDTESVLISDEVLMGVYSEIMDNIRGDRNKIDDVLSNFANMVLNEGDATTSSKEALVNLLKMKAEQADKMARVADLMTRLKLKEKDTFPKYMANNSNNNVIQINSRKSKRALLEALAKTKNAQSEDI